MQAGGRQPVGHQDDVVPWLHAMDIFALPTWAIEGVPQSIMQAMGCQLPVVSTKVGSIEDAVTHEVTGLLVPTKDVGALAEAIRRFLDKPKIRKRMGTAGRKRAKEIFSTDVITDRLIDVYESVLGEKA